MTRMTLPNLQTFSSDSPSAPFSSTTDRPLPFYLSPSPPPLRRPMGEPRARRSGRSLLLLRRRRRRIRRRRRSPDGGERSGSLFVRRFEREMGWESTTHQTPPPSKLPKHRFTFSLRVNYLPILSQWTFRVYKPRVCESSIRFGMDSELVTQFAFSQLATAWNAIT